MQKFGLIALMLTLVLLGACQTQALEAPPTEPAIEPAQVVVTPSAGVAIDPFQVDVGNLEVFEPGLIEEAQPILNDLSDHTLYFMDWTISSDLTTLQGEFMIQYTNQEVEALEEFFFRLYPNISSGQMSIADLTFNGEAVSGTLESADSVLRIQLTSPIEPEASVEIHGNFDVSLPLEMSGNYGLFGSFDGLLVLQEAYPIIPVYDQDGWDIDLPAPQGDLTYLDMSYYIVRVTLPEEKTVVASGYTLDHKIQDGQQSVTFIAGPARDFYFAAGDFERASDRFGETIIHSYFLEAGEPSSEASLLYGKAAIAILNERLGKYPYTEFDMISTPMLALGIEYPGIVALNLDMYDPGAQISGQPGTYFLESVIAHEVAHQWYYNLVGNDQIEHPWIDEAIVQYLTGIYFLDAYGEGAYQEYRQSWIGRWERVGSEPIPISLPVDEYEGRAYGAIVYGRGPLFIEAVAEELGEEAFWSFLRDFTETHAWGIAQPETFMTMAEAECSCNLTELWETWGLIQ